MTDVSNCFHLLRVPESLSRYFAMHPVRAKSGDLVGQMIDGSGLGAGDVVYPASAVVPMGFSWSLYIAQRINESLEPHK